MSHFAVLVIGEDAEEQLANYDENKEMPLHLFKTKEQLVKEQRESIEWYKNTTYAEFIADPEEYKRDCTNIDHIKYLEEEFPKMLEWTDEECYERAIEHYKDSDSGYKIDHYGNVYSVYNDNAKWDWYVLGGRYRGNLKLREGAEPLAPLYDGWQHDNNKERYRSLVKERMCDKAYKRDIENWGDENFVFFALLKDGIWYERGEMGWWAIVHNAKDEDTWDKEFRSLIANVSDDEVISVYDCHI